MAGRRMEWRGLSGPVVATPILCHAQAYQTAGSNRLWGLPNDNRTKKKLRTTPIVSAVRRSRLFEHTLPRLSRCVMRSWRNKDSQMNKTTESKRPLQSKRRKSKKKGCNTRTSQEVSHPCTTLAQTRLTSEF
ncbi:unnamed protein product [Prunus brigantina]